MPVEIKELIVQAKAQTAGKGNKTSKSDADEKTSAPASGSGVVGRITYDLRRQLVEDCVLEVMDKLQKNRMI